MDLVRSILLALEEHEHGYAPDRLTIDGHTDDEVAFHVYLMGEAGLLRVVDLTAFGDHSPSAAPLNIAWPGYEFLDAAREPSTWEKAKTKIVNAGGSLTFETLKAVLVALSKQALGLT